MPIICSLGREGEEIAKVFCKQLSRQNICIFHADMQNEVKKMSLIRLLVCAYYFIFKFSNIS